MLVLSVDFNTRRKVLKNYPERGATLRLSFSITQNIFLVPTHFKGFSTTPQFVMGQTFLNTSLWNEFLYIFLPLAHISMMNLVFPLKKRMSFFISSSKAKKWSLLIFEIEFPTFFILMFAAKNGRWSFLSPYHIPST